MSPQKKPTLKLSDFDYNLPPELIAQVPASERSHSRLLVYHKSTGQIEHRHFRDLPEYLDANHVLVMNSSKVLPARLHPTNLPSAEVLLLKSKNPQVWTCLVRPGKKMRAGQELVFGKNLTAKISAVFADGTRELIFDQASPLPEIERLGEIPLPPYIKSRESTPDRYQTVYADQIGSSAAPTAGLHFTPELLTELKSQNVAIEKVLLHVGLGTFAPVKTEDVTEHQMHSEFFTLSPDVATRLNSAKASGKKLVAVGTTSVRVLESATDPSGQLISQTGETDIFIYPPYQFRSVDALITNFHLPKSTLLMLVSAFIGMEECQNVYSIAIKEHYRFFSFGDACLFLD